MIHRRRRKGERSLARWLPRKYRVNNCECTPHQSSLLMCINTNLLCVCLLPPFWSKKESEKIFPGKKTKLAFSVCDLLHSSNFPGVSRSTRAQFQLNSRSPLRRYFLHFDGIMSCNEDKPKCCPNNNALKCPPPPPQCPNIPDTPIFKCPADDCKAKETKFCEEKKDDMCTCVGSCPPNSKQKKC